MLRVLASPESEERLAAATGFVRRFPPGTELLILGATREAADELARALAAAPDAPRRASFGLHRATLGQIAARLALPSLAARGLALTTRLGAEAATARAVWDALEEGSLGYFTPVARSPNFARAVAATLEELRLEGVPAEALALAGPPGRDLAVLLDRLATERDRARLADRADVLRAAAVALRAGQGDAAAIAGMPKLLLDVGLATRAEAELARALLERADAALATVPEGDERSLRALVALPFAERAPRAARPVARSLARLQADLFALEEPPAAEAGDDVRFFSAPGEGREAIEIARRIQEEARRGVPFDRMAIFVRAPRIYADLLEHALRRASVPAYFAFGSKRPHPSGRAFLALLACAAENLSARRFAEYLSLGQVPALAPGGEPPRAPAPWTPPAADDLGPVSEPLRRADARRAPTDDAAGTLRAPRRWERYLVDAAVLGGRDRWARRLAGLEQEWRARARRLSLEEPEAAELAVLARDLDGLASLRAFALPLVDALAALRAPSSWGGWIARLEALAAMALRRPDAVLSVLAELRPMAEVGPAGLDEVRQVLAERLSTLEEAPPRDRHGRVFVGAVSEARGRAFSVVFVPGLAERLFPQKPSEDPMLLDARRLLLADAGHALDTQPDRAQKERLLLRLAVSAATERIHLSYPRLDAAEARPRVPSFYGLDVLRATTGRIPDSEAIERDAAAASGARLAWPAPEAPERAIDDAEYDLAVLGPLLRGPSREDQRARARYLLRLNAHLARSLRARWWRWENRRWGAADGVVAPGDRALPFLAEKRPSARALSVSSLQLFAACPYRFYLSSVLGLGPRREPVQLERLDPATRGVLVHEVQAKVLARLASEGRVASLADELETALETLDDVLDEVAAAYEDELAPPIARVFEDEIARVRGDLRVWLRVVAGQSRAYEPLRFELGFGLRAHATPGSAREPARIGGRFLLRGAVDLVERDPATGLLRVTDYKTGADTTRHGLTIGGGEVLQPVLYGLAVEDVLGAEVREARLFFCTSRGGFAERVVPLDERARRAGVYVLEVVERAVEQGFLPPLPRRDACAGCAFRVVCGPHEEERSARKSPRLLASPGPHEDLERLRGMP
jgi:CRISPR/Cas system-associated exonuclease Cas4 (RecB family)